MRTVMTAVCVALLCGWAGNASAAMAEGHEHQARAAYQDQWVETLPDDPSDAWMIGFGGRMYDQWGEPLDKNLPVRSHPRYPRGTGVVGPETWRCTSCHGWDYRGNEALGFPGITGSKGAGISEILSVLRDGTHRYTEDMIPDGALVLVAKFVSEGQFDMDAFIDPTTGTVAGDAERGKGAYQNLCATCHGYDGRAQNFGNSEEPVYLGTLGNENPWEVMHKARNGQPGEAMPANLWMDISIVADIVAYIQTLPRE